MCVDCLKTSLPERDTTCLDDGSYIANFKHCKECLEKGFITIKNRHVEENEDDDDNSAEEITTYDHHCTSCDHKIAQHYHSFQQDDKTHEKMMECLLCGRGAATVKIQAIIDWIQGEKETQLNPYEDKIIDNIGTLSNGLQDKITLISQNHQKTKVDDKNDDEWE